MSRLKVDTFLIRRLDPHICTHIQVVGKDLRALKHSMKASAVKTLDNAEHSKKRKRARG